MADKLPTTSPFLSIAISHACMALCEQGLHLENSPRPKDDDFTREALKRIADFHYALRILDEYLVMHPEISEYVEEELYRKYFPKKKAVKAKKPVVK